MSGLAPEAINALVAQAVSARKNAYTPYSRFAVGAALLSQSGQKAWGCNIENISYGLTMCAERVAIGVAVQAGLTDFIAIAIVSDSQQPIMPCGACRQVLAEFNPSLLVISSTLTGMVIQSRLDILLPWAKQGILESVT